MSVDERSMFYGATAAIFENAKVLRRNMTDAEKHLWEYLSNKKFEGLKFRRQHPMGSFIADLYCHSQKLVIELDGSIHDKPDQEECDMTRQSVIEGYDVRVLRFKNEEVFDDVNTVLKSIKVFYRNLESIEILKCAPTYHLFPKGIQRTSRTFFPLEGSIAQFHGLYYLGTPSGAGG